MRERFKRIEDLLSNPFDPEGVIKELEKLLEDIPKLKREELMELEKELPRLKFLIERNYRIALGWLEELPRRIRLNKKA